MPSIDWLQADVVASQLGQQLSAGAGRDSDEPTGPGLHGTNIESVSYGDTTLQPGASNQLTYSPDSTFSVRFTNGGENDEFDVKVTGPHPGRQRRSDHAQRHDRPDRAEGQRDRQPRPRGIAAAGRRGDHPRERRAGAGRGEDRQQPGGVPGHLQRGLGERRPGGRVPLRVFARGRNPRGEAGSRPWRPAFPALVDCSAVDELTEPAGLVALAAAGVALIALVTALVLALPAPPPARRPARGARDQRPRRPRRPRELAPAGLRGAARARRGDGGAARRAHGRRRGAPRRRDRLPRAGALRRLRGALRATSRRRSRCSTPATAASCCPRSPTARPRGCTASRSHAGEGELELSPEEAEAVRLALAGEVGSVTLD